MTPRVGKEAFLSSLTFYKECYCHCYIESGTQSIFDSLGELFTKNGKKANKKEGTSISAREENDNRCVKPRTNRAF